MRSKVEFGTTRTPRVGDHTERSGHKCHGNRCEQESVQTGVTVKDSRMQ